MNQKNMKTKWAVLPVVIVCLIPYHLGADCGTIPSKITPCINCGFSSGGTDCSYTESDYNIFCCKGGASDEECADEVRPKYLVRTRHVSAVCFKTPDIIPTWICKASVPGPWATPVSMSQNGLFGCAQ